MITHQEALELVRILFFNINEKTLQELNRTSKIYDKLDNYITQQEKKEKLLELYKDLSNYVDEQTYAHKLPEITRLKILIEELENDKIWNGFNYLHFVKLVFNDNVCDFT